jgi:hypothetical protein
MLTAIAMSFFLDDCFDTMLEGALGVMVMSLTFADVYNHFDLADDLMIELPALFNELWYSLRNEWRHVPRTAQIDTEATR